MRTECAGCRYFHARLTRILLKSDTMGECRRFPPLLDDGEWGDHGHAIWPAVRNEDWCGAFEPPRVAPDGEPT